MLQKDIAKSYKTSLSRAFPTELQFLSLLTVTQYIGLLGKRGGYVGGNLGGDPCGCIYIRINQHYIRSTSSKGILSKYSFKYLLILNKFFSKELFSLKNILGFKDVQSKNMLAQKKQGPQNIGCKMFATFLRNLSSKSKLLFCILFCALVLVLCIIARCLRNTKSHNI